MERLRNLAHRPAWEVAAILGRSRKSVEYGAARYGIHLGGKSARWSGVTVRAARRLRAEGLPLRVIAERTGVPFGTLRHWVYSGVQA